MGKLKKISQLKYGEIKIVMNKTRGSKGGRYAATTGPNLFVFEKEKHSFKEIYQFYS